MLTHLPVMHVIVPLMAAPVCLILRRSRPVWLLSLFACAAAFAISMVLLQQVMLNGPISYQLGGWQPPWGIEYRIDLLGAYIMLLVSSIATIVLLASHDGLESELLPAERVYFHIAYLLCVSGLLGIAATGDIFNVFVFLEISALSSYILIGMGRQRAALWSSFQYLIMGSIGATFILTGIGLLYALTGTLNMQDLAQRLPLLTGSRTLITALAFLIAGVGLKMALFPLHTWLPGAYTHAPSVATAFLAATATKVAVYFLIRIVFTVFGVDSAFSQFPLQSILLALGVAGVIVASLAAIAQQNIKRLFAYSSVAQIGYIVLAIGVVSPAGLTAALLHVFNHGLMKSALFLALAAIACRVGGVNLSDVAGVGRRMPWTMAAIVLAGLSLIGVPLTVGFVSKWYLVVATLQQGSWWITAVVLAGSLLAVVYVWRIVEVAYFKPPEKDISHIREASPGLLLPIWLLVLANIYFGIDTRFTVEISQSIAQHLFGVAR